MQKDQLSAYLLSVLSCIFKLFSIIYVIKLTPVLR